MTTPSSTPGDMGAEPPGLPDSAMLARLANELFAEHLGALDQPAVAPGHLIGTQRPDAPALAPPAASSSAVPLVGPSGGPMGSIPNSLDEGAEVDLALPGPDARVVMPPVRPDLPVPEVPARPSADSSPYYFYDAAVDVLGSGPGWSAASAPSGAPPEFYFVRPDRRAPGSGPGQPGPAPSAPFDPQMVRGDFPILAERVNGRQLVWLDNAATTHKPRAVIDRLTYFYEHENSNVHRGAHELAARASDAYEAARDSVARFLGAPSRDDIVFVRGTTEAINLVAKSWGPDNVGPGDEILLSHLEHHANIVPWQQLAEERGRDCG